MINTSVDLFRFPSLSSLPGVVHGISRRAGGVSDGSFATLNTSFTVGDQREHVEENLSRVARGADRDPSSLAWAYQVHGRDAAVIENLPRGQPRPRCDILLTRRSEPTLMLRFADCVPMLLADPVQRAVGVAHAGWRGTAVGTATASVDAMVAAFGSRPADLLVGIGPAIGPCCYEVGADVVEAFRDRPWALLQVEGRQHLDLWETNRRALLAAGVPDDHIEVTCICTKCESDRFFSHRASGGQPSGRFAALIGLAI